jgi:hypothetical protein
MSEQLQSLMAKKEDLHPELKMFLTTIGSNGIPAIQNPILYDLFYSKERNALLNFRYQHKKDALQKAMDENNLSSYIWLHERPYRVTAFKFFTDKYDVKDEDYWSLLKDVWTDSENIWQNKDLFKKLLSSKRKGKEYFMDTDENNFFAQLPEEFIIYRGYHEGKNKKGFSYTLDKNIAEWFSVRFTNSKLYVPNVKEIVVKKKDVFAYINSREEKEIIYLK